jgi:hypothetical protein
MKTENKESSNQSELGNESKPMLCEVAVKMFKAKKQTKRFRKNQKVWVTKSFANYAYIRFKWRGNGRYVNGVIDKWNWSAKANFNTSIGEEGFKEIMVSKSFALSLGCNLT